MASCHCVELAHTVTELTNLNAVQRPYNPLSPIIKSEEMCPLFRQRIEERGCGQTRSVPEPSEWRRGPCFHFGAAMRGCWRLAFLLGEDLIQEGFCPVLLWVVEEFFWAPLLDDASVVEEHHSIRGCFGESHLMRDDQHRHSLSG